MKTVLIITACACMLLAVAACTPKIPAASAAKQQEERSETLKTARIGETVQAGNFAVTVNSTAIKESINVGNEFLNRKREEGIQYLILDVTFKNTGTEAEMLFDGVLYINDGTRVLEMNQSETILQEGWGLFLDNINPMLTKRTKIVYKASTDMKGFVSWLPHGGDVFILLGNLE